jgi:ParB family transcriptional regulator, chromosome partitioning protein
MNIQMIPLNQLVPSPANVRKTGTMIGIEELAASITAHGLLQNLQVEPGAKGKFEVVAGGRRLAALKLLVKQKSLAKDAAIACHVLDTEDAGEISLAENTLRLPMHPADQFAAFHALAETGKGPEDIAARFGTSAATVRQRLKLATISPRLMELYRSDEMTLDHLMAFTVSDDHDAQEAAWFGQPNWQRDPGTIRRTLTAAHVDATDRRVRFIGLERYQAVGGGIVRDLFEPEHEGYLTDPALLDRLAAEQLEADAAKVRTEGWKWVEIMSRLDYATLSGFGRVYPERLPLPADQQDELDRLTAEYDALIDQHGDDPEPEIVAQLEALSEKIDALPEEAEAWRSDVLAFAGAIVSIGHGGNVEIQRGLLRAEDKKAHAALVHRATESGADGAGEPDAHVGKPDRAARLSASLIEDLTAERTAALRAVMQDNEGVALAAVAHALALPLFYGHAFRAESCLDLRLVSRDLRSSAEGIAQSGAMAVVTDRRTAWEQRLPDDAGDLFGWLLAEDRATVISLIAFCTAMSVDAVRGKHDRHDCPRLSHADELAGALDLNMARWWEPTKERYLGRVSKALILDAVAEAASPTAADNLASLKKSQLVTQAGERLAGKGWLPPILRSPSTVASDEAPINGKPMRLAAE